MAGTDRHRESAHSDPYQDPTPSVIGRSRAEREKTRRDINEQMRQHQRDADDAFFRWTNDDGTPIDIPTVMAEFARAVGREIAAIRAEAASLYDAVEANTQLTEHIALKIDRVVALADRYDRWAERWKYGKKFAKFAIIGAAALMVAGVVCGIALSIYVMSGGLNWLAPLVKAAQGG